jgi:hypothetical protein
MWTGVLLIRYQTLVSAKFEVYTVLIDRIWSSGMLVCIAGKITYPGIPLGSKDTIR